MGLLLGCSLWDVVGGIGWKQVDVMEGTVSLLESSLLLETVDQESWIFGLVSLIDWMPYRLEEREQKGIGSD